MTKKRKYKCVNCGEAATELFRTYGPTVLKLTKCEKCKGIVDKYIEYDPVIVIIDLVLMSKEAQRHILYNTEFQTHWKLGIILIMLETYAVWRSDSLFNIAVNSVCGIESNSTNLSIPINISHAIPELWKGSCWAWAHQERDEEYDDLFIWEKAYYIQSMSILSGIIVFIGTVQLLMRLATPFSTRNKVSLSLVLKAFSLADVSILFTLPMLVWGAETSADTKIVHYLLVHVYHFVVFLNVFTVVYECPLLMTTFILIIANTIKHITSFHATPVLKMLFS